MRAAVRILQRSVKLVNENFLVVGFAIVFGLVGNVSSSVFLSVWLKLLLSIVGLAWLGVKVLLLYQGYSGTKWDIKQVLKQIVKYMKTLVPAIGLLIVLGLIPVVVIVGFFLRWFLGEYAGQLGEANSGLGSQLSLALSNPTMWAEFGSSHLWLFGWGWLGTILTLMGALVVSLFLVVMVVEQKGAIATSKEVGRFLIRQPMLGVYFVVLRLAFFSLISLLRLVPGLLLQGLALVGIAGNLAFSGESGLWSVFLWVLSIYLGLILDSFVIIYYVERSGFQGLVTRVKRVVRRHRID